MSIISTIFALILSLFGNVDGVDTANTVDTTNTATAITEASSSSTPNGVELCVNTSSHGEHLVINALDNNGDEIIPETVTNVTVNGQNEQLNCFAHDKNSTVSSINVVDASSTGSYEIKM